MVLVANDLQNQLKQAINYLVPRVDKCFSYEKLIEELKQLQLQIENYQIKITLVGHRRKLISVVQNISVLDNPKDYLLKTVTLPTEINQIVNDSDLILLVLDSTKQRTPQEQNLIKKAVSFAGSRSEIASPIILGIVILQNSVKQSLDINLEQQYKTSLNIFNLLNDNLDSQYQTFFNSLVAKSISSRKLKFKQQTLKTINQYFNRVKEITWSQIKQQKDFYFSGQNPEQIQQIINQLPHRCNRLIQNYLRIFKQNKNQNKIDLINPFLSDSLMYKIQNAIQEAEVISQKEQEKTYLRLVIKNQDYIQTIHTYVMENCQQSLETWLKQEWQKITTQYNDGGLNKLQQQLQLEIENIACLCQDINLVPSEIEPQLQLENYICLSALESNSQITFDYHYTHSTWFRLLISICIGGIIFLLFKYLWGVILLIIQIINLITGQDTKSTRLRQQSKELKRIIDSKYQFLVRFLADKTAQSIAIALDKIDRDYQDRIDNIIQIANQQLQAVKQDINLDKEQIDELKRVHLRIQKIFQNE